MELPAAVFTAMFFICSVVYGSVHRSKRQDEFFSQEVTNFNLVKPTKVTSDGQFLSHDVKHYTKHFQNRRYRRSVQDEHVHYLVHIDGLQTLLKLRPNIKLLGPGMIVERKGKMSRIAPSKHYQEHCFFQGNIVDNSTDSHVALSTCVGLVS
ncbi:hypothetical protein NPIL_409761 [Nephila pilipes]|uniref:Peptidase M12B propeptide domain-containing protein n=1 Tax=Nephila pilipes TaxID=299642 RepID=A0A8X6N389_NEPPI|nr:hypothetical protein NPIL_409761 [Nephila pilipes]